MNQAFSAPVIQQPEKPKKNFCFATIPLIFIALDSLIVSISGLKSIPSNWYELLGSADKLCRIITEFMYLFHFVFIFIGAVILTILLFAKKNNASLGLPLLMFSAGNLFMCGAEISGAYGLTCGEEIIFDSFAEALWDSIPIILICFLASVAFLVVAVYTFIITLRKKPAPKVLWIIPEILFCILYAPLTILFSIYILDIASIDILWALEQVLHFAPYYSIYGLFPIAIILFLLWLSFPYKKDKSKKTAEVQPAPATPPVTPAVTPAVQPVAEAKSEEVDPERTIDYSYTEVFYPPVDKPADKPAADTVAKPEVSNDIERLRNNTQFLKEYKALLDDGLITQEDYDKKKNELLGL